MIHEEIISCTLLVMTLVQRDAMVAQERLRITTSNQTHHLKIGKVLYRLINCLLNFNRYYIAVTSDFDI